MGTGPCTTRPSQHPGGRVSAAAAAGVSTRGRVAANADRDEAVGLSQLCSDGTSSAPVSVHTLVPPGCCASLMLLVMVLLTVLVGVTAVAA